MYIVINPVFLDSQVNSCLDTIIVSNDMDMSQHRKEHVNNVKCTHFMLSLSLYELTMYG